tara:strand:+ start:10418 stop:11419 length:1002 start_codon:yes stop_codon:yes gene_type:complete
MDNLYEILGIDSNASIEEIKKAYRKQSLLNHPDRTGGSSEQIKKINEAYEILGDPQKRRIYDMESSNPFLNMSGNNINPMDIFSKLFNPGNLNSENQSDIFNKSGVDPMFPFGGMGGIGGPKIHIFRAGGNNMPFPDFENMNSVDEPEEIEITVKLSLYEAYNGCNKPIEVNRYIVRNNKKSYEKETIYVNFYKGIDNNECIILSQKGNIINGEVGNIKVKIQLDFKDNFSRKGLDLIYNKYLTLEEAFCGFSFMLDHINGKSYKINHNGEYIIQPNYTKEIPNMGFQREDNFGKLIIIFHIIFPENISLEKRKKISEILNGEDTLEEEISNV